MELMPVLQKRMQSSGFIGNLPSLTHMLRDLEQFTSKPTSTIDEICRCISMDPALSVRLLRLANSAYYARTEPVASIEEAVIFLGVSQVRIVSMTTRAIEVMIPKGHHSFEWTEFWRHCIATAHGSRMISEILRLPFQNLEISYLAGLMHDVGKLVIAMLSPDAFDELVEKATEHQLSFQLAEQQYSDTDHGALGGWYLEKQRLPPPVFEAVRCHHSWSMAVKNPEIAAIVNVADQVARSNQIGISGNMEPISLPFHQSESWNFILAQLKLTHETESLQERISQESLQLISVVDSILPRPSPSTSKPTSETKRPHPSSLKKNSNAPSLLTPQTESTLDHQPLFSPPIGE